jgi:siroheme synthase (precorrin-2 oxidase/ferrochelatase)
MGKDNEQRDSRRNRHQRRLKLLIREGERVRVVSREVSPPTHKYAGQKGYVTMTSPSIYGPVLFVQLVKNPDGIDTAFEEEDLEEVPPLED